MDLGAMLITASLAIVTSIVTAYWTARLQFRAEQRRAEHELALRYAESTAESPDRAKAMAKHLGKGVVVVIHANGERQKFDIPPAGVLEVGRDETCDISLSDPACSRRHCKFVASGSGVFLEDLGTTTGTVLNGKMISGSAKLSDEDKVSIGQTEMRVLVTT